MASATLYTARLIGPEILEAGASNTITCPVYRDGAVVAPTAGTLTVWNASNTKIVDASAVTISSSVATYTVTSGMLTGQTNSDGWRFEWSLTIAGSSVVFRRDGSLVYRRLYPVVTDADLLRSHTDLTRRTPSTETSYQDYLDEAWARIESRLINTGKRPWLIMSPSALRDVHVYLTLALVFRDFATGGDGSAEWQMMVHYEALYADAWGELTFPEASPTSGQEADPSRRRGGTSALWLAGRG